MVPGFRLMPCPRCGFLDAVLSVPSAHAAARNTEAAGRVAADTDAGRARRNAAWAASQAGPPVVASRELAPAPMQYLGFYGCLGGLAGVVATVMFVIYFTATGGSPGDSVLLIAGGAAAVVSALGLVMLVRESARRSAVTAGRSAAEAIWRRGWYCCRCAVVFFSPGEEPGGVGQSQPLTPPQFRQIVWTAGGFHGPTAPPRP